MAEETITILKVGTEEAVKSIADLKENVKILKKSLDDLEIGTQEYQDTLDEIKVNQNALKDAMYATSSSMEDVAQSATGVSESYNSLVHRMAALKEEFRSTNNEVRRLELGQQIKEVNDQLKEMDALQGNFQRNVGNYAGSIKDAFKDMAEKTDAFGKSLNLAGGGINGFKDSFEAFGKSPAIATFGILVSVALKLADYLKEDETAMAALKKLMEATKPIMDFFKGVLGKISEILSTLIEKVSQFITSNGIFSKIVDGLVGVGNAILKFVIAPFKGIVEAIKVFREEGIKGIGNAAKAFANEMKNGVAFKSNFEAGESMATAIISGARNKEEDVKQAGTELGKKLGEGASEGIKYSLKDLESLIAAADKKEEEARKWREQEQKDIDAMIEADLQQTESEIEEYFAEQERLRAEDLKDAEEKAKQKIEVMQSVASATSSILGSIADIYESDTDGAEKNAKKIKALRIASATIDTISGAIGAYMQAVKTLPAPAGAIVGAIQAAAVTAAGVAQIAKIKNTNVAASESASNTSPNIPAISAAPTLTTEVANVRSLTSASEEDRLNQMASDQRVYIVASDIEASQNQIKTQVAESSF